MIVWAIENLKITAGKQFQGCRIGHPVGESRLVHVEANAADRRGDTVAYQAGADKGATYLTSVDVDIVGPLN